MAMEKTFDASTAETAIYRAWEAAGAFRAGANKSRDESFCIMIPPPNVTGVLHMGHAFNNTLQDILIRWKRMQGFDTLWQPGTDHAGIATQMVVERMLAETQQPSRVELGREAFLSKVWEWKEQSGGTIINQLKRLGASCDWDRTAFTMSGAPGAPEDEAGGNFHDAVLKVFVEMYNKGLIYRGKRLVNWDPHFETAISDLEVENIEVPGHMWHFKYPLAGGATYEYVEKDEDGNVTLRETRDYISIATTRPETMLGDGAVAVHPDDERYAPIVGHLCEIPVGPKEHRRLIPIITDDYPDPDFGSGAVKITGAHDFNDYQVAKRGGIPLYRLMDTKGAMRADGAPYAEEAAKAEAIVKGGEFTEASVDAINLVPEAYRGLDRFEARKAVVADITAEGLAVMVEVEVFETPDQVRGTADGGDSPAADLAPAPALAPAPEPGPLPDSDSVESGDSVEEVPDQVRDAYPIPYVENKPIMQPFGDRSKVVIEPMLTDQWFVDAEKVVGPALEAVRSGEVKILPESGEKTYYHWLENIEPWCISRQLWWGHQIPVWYGFDLDAEGFKDDEGDGALDLVEMGQLLLQQRLLRGEERLHCAADFESVQGQFVDVLAGLPTPISHAEVVEVADREAASHTLAASLAEYVATQNPTKLVYPVWRDPDVLDTWFSSGLWPIGTLGWPDQTDALKTYFPTSTLVTGQDILFFWVARMMMMQLAVVDQVPFDTVYLHGLVRDAKGKKMSKSTGNVMDPLDIIDEYGADALRFSSAAMAALGGVLKLDMSRIAGYRNFGTKLWNAARFAEMNDCKPSADFDPSATTQTVNKWIVGETARALETVDAALTSYRFNDAASTLYAFVWGKVCDWYVELAKPLFQGEDQAAKAETQATMAWVIDQCLILLHPIMPFITEQLWGDIAARDTMLIHQEWPTYASADLVDKHADREMNWVVGLIEQVRSVRQAMHVPAGAKIEMITLDLDTAGQAALAGNLGMIQRLARLETVSSADVAPQGAVTLAVEGGTFCLPLADVIDVAAEKARLEKALQKLAKEAGGIKGKLANEKFLSKAPEEVVTENRDRLAVLEEESQALQAAFDRIAALA